MKKILTILLMLTVIAGINAQYKDGYYNALNGKKKEALKAAVKTCVEKHTRLEYYDLPYNWRYTDTYPERYNGAVRWWEMYSNNIYLINDGQSPVQSFSANRMQREHSIPKSWWKYNNDVEYTPAYTDLWNLLPSDGACNQEKSNYPFGEVAYVSYTNGSAKVGTPASGIGGGAAKVFEPADEYKGDFARNIFYMACVYDDLPWVTYNSGNMFQTNTWPTLKPWAYQMLLEWHRADPVSQKEIDRNNAVETQQGNRNPFIDFPNLAEYIWGKMTDVVFYLNDNGGDATPFPDEPYLTAPEKGMALDFGQCALQGSVTAYLEIRGMITQNLTISLSGTDKEMFTLGMTTVTPAQLNPSKTMLVPISFTPTSTGEKTANLILYDGGFSGTTKVTLIGEAFPIPTLSTLTAYEATEVREESYVANWSVAPEVVDYYVVHRTIYGSEGTESEDLESNYNYLLIDRSENVMETYTVSSSRLGYLSAASNSITVSPGAGIYRVDAEATLGVETDNSGFTLISECEAADVAVYDLSGRLVYRSNRLAPFVHVELPAGMYILSSSFLNRPYKILIP